MTSLIRAVRPAVATVAALAGLLGVLLAVQTALSSHGHRAVARSSEFVAWSALVSLSVVTYVQIFVKTVRVVRRPSPRTLVVSIIAYVLVAAVVYLTLTGHGPPRALETVPLVMRPFYAVAEIAAAPAVLGLWLVYNRLDQVDHWLQRWPARPDGVLSDLLAIRTDINRCLAGLSLIASTGLITATALRNAYLAHGVRAEQFPSTSVLLFGGTITAIIALIYVPVFLAWRERATALINTVYPMPADARPTEEWMNGRARLRELVGVDTTVVKTLVTTFGVLAPLAISLLGLTFRS